MAKLEIPCIIVQSGSITPPKMDRVTRRAQWSLSTQSTFEEVVEPVESVMPEVQQSHTSEGGGNPLQDPPPSININNNTLSRSRSKNSLKLLRRSSAVKESTSPPPDISPPRSPPPPHSPPPPPCGYSTEQQSEDQSKEEIEKFIIDILNNKKTKDRNFLLRVESDLVTFAKDHRRNYHRFAPMTSFQRMIVHKVADYFGMDHNTDASGFTVVVSKSKNTRIPDSHFHELFRFDVFSNEEPRKSILKRDSASFEEASFKSGDRCKAEAPRRSKSFEEREEEYEKARHRIFYQEQQKNSEENANQLYPESNRLKKLVKTASYETGDVLKANSMKGALTKTNSLESYVKALIRPPSTKSLTKQDSSVSVGSSRFSPSSSGYKSQPSEVTISNTPSPIDTPETTSQLSSQSHKDASSPEPTLLWAVTNINSVPVGSILIDPQSGLPVKNEDGSIYTFDPKELPKMSPAHLKSNFSFFSTPESKSNTPTSESNKTGATASKSPCPSHSLPPPQAPSRPNLTPVMMPSLPIKHSMHNIPMYYGPGQAYVNTTPYFNGGVNSYPTMDPYAPHIPYPNGSNMPPVFMHSPQPPPFALGHQVQLPPYPINLPYPNGGDVNYNPAAFYPRPLNNRMGGGANYYMASVPGGMMNQIAMPAAHMPHASPNQPFLPTPTNLQMSQMSYGSSPAFRYPHPATSSGVNSQSRYPVSSPVFCLSSLNHELSRLLASHQQTPNTLSNDMLPPSQRRARAVNNQSMLSLGLQQAALASGFQFSYQ